MSRLRRWARVQPWGVTRDQALDAARAACEEVRRRADADDRSVSGWIRRAVEHELERDAG